MVLATFVFILILMIRVEDVSTLVLPPENVTVSCHNFQTRAYWNYSKHPVPPNFILHFVSESSENKTVIETTELHYDLTHLMRASSFSNRYSVEVRAVEGAETSQHVSSPIITFNMLKMADVKCTLDFPPVQLSPDDMGIAVSFPNPFDYYKELAEFNPFDRVFHYKVFTKNTSDMSSPATHKCTMERTCGMLLPSSRGPYCVQLNGSIMSGRIQFKKTANICAQDHHPHESYVSILLGVVLAVFIVVSLVMIVMVYQVKAWKRNPSILPKALASLITNPNERRIMQLPEDRVEHIAIEDDQSQTEEVEIIEVERPCCMAEDQNAQLRRLLEEDEEEDEEDECPPSGYGHAHSLDM